MSTPAAGLLASDIAKIPLITAIRGLHLTGAAQVSALPPESAWQVLDPA